MHHYAKWHTVQQCHLHIRLSVIHCVKMITSLGKEKGKEEYLYSAFLHQGTHKALRHGSHSFTWKQHHACLSLFNSSTISCFLNQIPWWNSYMVTIIQDIKQS